MSRQFNLNLRRCNDALSLAVIAVALYIFLLPALPQASWWLDHSAPIFSRTVGQSAESTIPSGTDIPEDDRLLIPALTLNESVFSGSDVSTVEKGIWIRPNASTPDQGGNTVLVGHRFTYADPQGVFYFLDKIEVGDVLTFYWKGEVYNYKTREIKVVQPTDTTVEQPSTKQILTLYTCTPLWSLKDRLVIVADFIEAAS